MFLLIEFIYSVGYVCRMDKKSDIIKILNYLTEFKASQMIDVDMLLKHVDLSMKDRGYINDIINDVIIYLEYKGSEVVVNGYGEGGSEKSLSPKYNLQSYLDNGDYSNIDEYITDKKSNPVEIKVDNSRTYTNSPHNEVGRDFNQSSIDKSKNTTKETNIPRNILIAIGTGLIVWAITYFIILPIINSN